MKWSLKEVLDMLAAFFTIVVSVIALKGTIDIYRSGFFHKVGHLVDHYHAEVLEIEKKNAQVIKKL